jgi:hypothetical protein
MDGGANRRSTRCCRRPLLFPFLLSCPPPLSLHLLPLAVAQPRLPPEGSGGKTGAEPGGATKSWLRLPFGSREVLQGQLHTRSRSKIDRLGGLRVEPLVEPEPEPSQTGPDFFSLFLSYRLFAQREGKDCWSQSKRQGRNGLYSVTYKSM